MKSVQQAGAAFAPPMAEVQSAVARRGMNAVQVFLACLLFGVAGGTWTRDIGDWLRVSFLLGCIGAAVMIGFAAVVDFVVDIGERLTQHDIDGDGEISGRRVVLVNRMPLEEKSDRDQFAAFVWQCKTNTSLRYLEPQGFAREQIEEWRDMLIKAGMARWRSERGETVGWELAAEPDAILRQIEWPE